MPWMPIYIGFVFLLHPVLGRRDHGWRLVMLALTLTTEKMLKKPSAQTTDGGN